VEGKEKVRGERGDRGTEGKIGGFEKVLS